MALDGGTAGTAVFNALVAAGLANDEGDAEQIWQIVCTELLAHIAANGLVTVTVASVSGVTPGGGSSGPGTGTGTIS